MRNTSKRTAWARQRGTLLNLGWAAWVATLDLSGFEKVISDSNVTFRGDGIEMRIEFWPDWDALDYKGKRQRVDNWTIAASGHTNFSTERGQRTFDRVGVDDSFYVNPGDTADTLREKLVEQITRVAASRERLARSEAVPGLPGGWVVTPERRAEIGKVLASGRGYDFRPAGFGIGYHISTHRLAFGQPLPRATADFFGIDRPLFFETMDCD